MVVVDCYTDENGEHIQAGDYVYANGKKIKVDSIVFENGEYYIEYIKNDDEDDYYLGCELE